MTIADITNGVFELFAGLFILLHCRRVVIDKKVRGASIVATAFFTAWGFWNLYYYPSLNQWASFFGGFSVFFSNLLWIILMIKYRNN